MLDDDSLVNIKKKPYQSIISWGENRLKLTGIKVFPLLALQPVSLIMPEIPQGNGFIRQRINVLLLSPSGAGKTSIIDMMFKISYNPFDFLSITSAEFEDRLYIKKKTSLLCGDIAIVFKDPRVIKHLESVIGEESKISRFTKVKERDFQTNATFLGCGLPEALTRYVNFGLLQRLSPLVIFHTPEEKIEMARAINNGIGKYDNGVNEESIISYYRLLDNIQDGKTDYPKVEGYVIDEGQKQKIFSKWEELVALLGFSEQQYLVRELHSGYRYLCGHAMLNYFNRKMEGSNIRITDEDLDVALKMLSDEMTIKSQVLSIDRMVNRASDIRRLYDRVINDDSIGIVSKEIMKVMVASKYAQ